MRKMIIMLAVLTCLAVSSASAWVPPDCTGEINYCVR